MDRSWVPKGALALLGVAVLLVAAFAIANPSWFGSDDDKRAADRAFDKTLRDIGSTDGLRLSDDNATTQTFTVPVPIDSRVERPVLALRGRTEVAESSTIFLRALVNGESVYVKELPQGEHKLDVDIGLPESTVEDGEVKVQVRTTGSLDQRRCNLTTELGALVVLDARTRIKGELDERTHTVRDAVAELDHHVTVVLPTEAKSTAWFETAARLSAFLTQQGHEVSYTEDLPDEDDGGTPVLVGPADALDDLGWNATGDKGSIRVGERGDQTLLGVVDPSPDVVPAFLTTSAVTTADTGSSAPRSEQLERATGDQVTLEALGADTSVQQIIDRRSWRVPYALSDLPGGGVPTSVRLRMLVPPTTEDARWLVQVRLNDELVDSLLLPDVGRQTVVAKIPGGRELVRNELVVTLVRDRDVGGCNVRQTPYDVQLLPESALTIGTDGAGFTAVPRAFAAGFDVLVPSSSLKDPTTALAQLVPTLAEFDGWRQQPTYRWDGTPGDRAYFALGSPPTGVTAPVTVRDGRLSAKGFDLSAFKDGLVVQCVTSGRTQGLVVTPVGRPGDVVPDYGRESARLVTAGGGGFVVSGAGRVVSAPAVRAEGTE
ncbi:hypothetical protein [Aeromicrobium chenweiae]|uniref:Uncharacterized protein n=1 Tax=Aeromicrobium chenweiae TaxID=2079793 RepID=A0A2S0WLX0_9ACTN|nr:hypothetical protein [Aeromicrobium chenweiae]AWB92333.1 hypothetical protein C3E78_09045 [Aeromicrobium chenweiae]TGN31380.1 hypothetical protein E4L97_13525 [Aeromicrobium chenweiae]